MSSHNLISKDILAEIGPQLKQFRLDRNLSLEELQDKTHLHIKLLRRMEKGQCLTFSAFRRLINFYGKKIKILLE